MESWELTEYEQQRSPQEITMDPQIAISPRSLYRELTCPICLDILKQTMTIRECLHRFCSVCITKVLESGNKECPTCRKKLTSRKCFRPDPNFDLLVSQLREHDRAQVTSRNVVIRPECEIILKSLDGQKTRYIKCAYEATVEHLSKYLSMRPDCNKLPELNKDLNFKICIAANRAEGHYEMLQGSMNLEEIQFKYKLDTDKTMELCFYSPDQD